MRELFVTSRDAFALITAAANARKGHRPRPPKLWYMDDPEYRVVGLSGASLEAAVDRLDRRFPGRVSTRVN